MTRILGIETSCDETAAAVVDDGVHVRSNVVASQFDLHAKYGGVVPEIASRAHIERLDAVVREALSAAGCGRDEVEAVAVTCAPGLVGSLLIGVTGAKTLAWAWGKPLVGVHHIEAHALSPALGAEFPPWPAAALIASGGHTSLYHVRDPDQIELLGATTDDAAGEAFDKVATILGLPYPGGPQIDRLARQGDPKRYDFPRTWLGRDSLDFSFSGIKTAVMYEVHGHGRTSGGLERLSPQDLADLAASFQEAVVEVLVRKTLLAAERIGVRSVVTGGGVAANSRLRQAMQEACQSRGYAFRPAPMPYCIDNAAMIAAVGYYKLRRGELAGLDLDARPH
ncbi:MAG: tRNA N6-adenosine threonylcarbamoyltransferase [Planctomycetota bacterium]|nr:MAG: tRNA N6-adenosine threonylcarbamoyltransferase [Planctomycetota bacterium]